jgi:hypothetical protein
MAGRAVPIAGGRPHHHVRVVPRADGLGASRSIPAVSAVLRDPALPHYPAHYRAFILINKASVISTPLFFF